MKNILHQKTQASAKPADPLPETKVDAPAPAVVTSGLSHKEIATEAETLWRSQGFPVGRDQEIWLEAERSLLERQRLRRNERDRSELADPRFAFNKKSGHMMDELRALFPNPQEGQSETTTL